MSVYLGLSVGPSLGGLLTYLFGWRSVFYVNVPIGLLVIALSLSKLKEKPRAGRRERFDLLGAGAFSLSLVSFLAGLTFGDGSGWGTPFVSGLLASAGILFLSFLFVERRKGAKAVLDLSLFTGNRLFAAANLSALLNYTSYFGVSFFISFYLQSVLGYNSLQAGIVLLAMPLSMAALSPFSGWLSDRFGSRGLSSLGMAIIMGGLLLMSTVSLASSVAYIATGLLVIGIGMGLFSSPNTSAVMGSVDRGRLGVASGTLSTMRFSGQSLSLALMGAIVVSVIPSSLLASLLMGVTVLHVNVAREAFVEGMSRAFEISAAIAALGVVTSLQRGSRADVRHLGRS